MKRSVWLERGLVVTCVTVWLVSLLKGRRVDVSLLAGDGGSEEG